MGKRVLVVDDNADMVHVTVEHFRARGFEAKGCFNGKEAIQSVQDYDPDAVVMDIAMPGITGWDVARMIRSEFPHGRPLLIAVTGEYKGATDLILSKMHGFDHYLLKPADPETLIALIEGRPA